MQQISVNDAQSRLSSLIDQAINGETVHIVDGNGQIVQLIPVRVTGHPQFGSAEGLISMAQDFDESLEDFREYMQRCGKLVAVTVML